MLFPDEFSTWPASKPRAEQAGANIKRAGEDVKNTFKH